MTGLQSPADETQRRESAGAAPLGVGIRAERLRQGLTLAQLAERAGLSPSALSQIERGVTDPSIGSLRRIATALGVPFFRFLLEPESRDPVVRKRARPTIQFPGRALQNQHITAQMRGPFEVLSLTLEPGAASGEEALGHDSDECLLVLEGTVDVELAGQCYRLEAGDSVSIQRNLPHRAVNRSAEPAEILMVISPPSF